MTIIKSNGFKILLCVLSIWNFVISYYVENKVIPWIVSKWNTHKKDKLEESARKRRVSLNLNEIYKLKTFTPN